MALFKKKIELSDAVIMFVNSVMEDCKSRWPTVVECINRNGFKIHNEDEGYGAWVTGLLAIDTLYAYQVHENNIASSIYKDVGYYFDFRVEELKEWPPILMKMYNFFCYTYLMYEEEYKKNPIQQNTPLMGSSMTVLLGIILSYKNITKNDSIPYNSQNTQKMFNDFFLIVLKSIGRWEKISKEYRVNWPI